jgi:hypothetical protein
MVEPLVKVTKARFERKPEKVFISLERQTRGRQAAHSEHESRLPNQAKS